MIFLEIIINHDIILIPDSSKVSSNPSPEPTEATGDELEAPDRGSPQGEKLFEQGQLVPGTAINCDSLVSGEIGNYNSIFRDIK